MKHRIYHSLGLARNLAPYAERLRADLGQVEEAYRWMIDHDVVFEEESGELPKVSICSIDIEKRIEHPLARRLYAMLRDEVPTTFIPLYGINWPTFVDRWHCMWDQLYNIFVNKIPFHFIRLAWLRLGGAKIGRGSTIWRNTEVLGMKNLVIGEDSCIGWHCQIDARAGLIIGSHVAVASYAKIIAGTHDLASPHFWSVSGPVHIDDYAWIATGALIGHGVRIGVGAVVTAQTLVGKDVAPYKIVGGSGAKVMGERPHDLAYRVGGKGLFTLLH